jgi:hypothetical protein
MELENGKALKEGIQLQHTHNNTKMQVKFHLFLDVNWIKNWEKWNEKHRKRSKTTAEHIYTVQICS